MSLFADWLSIREASAPGVAVEIASNRVTAAAIDGAVVTAHASEPLPDDALVPSLMTANIRQEAVVRAALSSVLERVGRPARIALVVPDPVAKVSLLRFEQVPPRAQDLDGLIRWQLRKTAPFPIEDAQVSFVPGARHADGQEFVVSLARRDIVSEYENLCSGCGAHAGLVDTSTFNVINAALAGWVPGDIDWLLVNVAADYASVAILRGTAPLFFRSRGADAEGTLADLVHQTAMYYEDRLQGRGFKRILLSGVAAAGVAEGAAAGQIRQSLQERLAMAVEPVDVRLAVSLADRIDASAALLDTLAPAAGLLLRARRETAA